MIYVDEGEIVYVTETVYHEESGLPRRQWTTLNGLKHAPPSGEPSLIAWDDQGRIVHKYWHAFDLEHKIDGPAAIVFYPENGKPKTEDFKIDGQPLSKEQGPFRIRRDLNGLILHEEYISEDGQRPEYSPPLPKP